MPHAHLSSKQWRLALSVLNRKQSYKMSVLQDTGRQGSLGPAHWALDATLTSNGFQQM